MFLKGSHQDWPPWRKMIIMMTKMTKMALLMIIMVEIMMIKLPWLDASCSGDWPNNRHWFPIPSHPPSLQNQSHHHHHHYHHHHHHRRLPQLFTEQVSKNCNRTGLWTMPFVWYTHFKQIVTNLKKRKPIRNHRNSQISLDTTTKTNTEITWDWTAAAFDCSGQSDWIDNLWRPSAKYDLNIQTIMAHTCSLLCKSTLKNVKSVLFKTLGSVKS